MKQKKQARVAKLVPSVRDASAVPRRDRLQRRETVQRLETLFPAMPRFTDSAERQLDAATRAVIVEEHLPRAQRLGEPHLPPPVRGPDASHEAVAGPVSDRDRLGLVVKGNDHLDRPEDFLLRQAMSWADIGEQSRGDVISALRRILYDLCGANHFQISALRYEAADDRLLPLGDEWPDVEIGVGRPDLQSLVARRHALDDLAVNLALDQNAR